MELVKAINFQLVQIELTRNEAIERTVSFLQRDSITEAIELHRVELEAVKLVPYYQIELIEQERVLDKKYVMWTNDQKEDFENRFVEKYFKIERR